MPEKVIKTTPPENDPVKHPKHYCYGKFECLEVIQELTAGASGPEGFLLGNVIKYLWRYRRKNGVEDLRKARRYIEMLIRLYEDPAPAPAPGEKAPDGTSADTAIIDVAPGTVPIRDNRPVFGETTTWAAARLTGQNGEFFDGGGTRRTRGMLVRIDNGLPAPYIARIQITDPGPGGTRIARYVTMPYKHFSPLPPEPENGRPVFNRVVAEGAARYIGKEGEFFDKPGGTRKRGVLQLITGPACDFRFSAMTEGGRGIYAFFSPLNPEPELQETGADENEQEKPDA